jgi:hypothetical protein
MRSAAVCGLLLLLVGATASAQFSITPQVGFEQSKTALSYNNLSSFAPLGWQGTLKAALHMDYRFKNGFGPYASVGSSPAVVAFSFANPSDALNNYKAATESLQWRLEGGYQFTSKPILLKKGTAKNIVSKSVAAPTEYKRSCGSYQHHGCGQQKSVQAFKKPQNNNLNLRLQPSLGVSYIPDAPEDFKTVGNTTQYNAGNWKTAVVSALGFEFDKGHQRLLTLNIFYSKGLTNLDTKTFTKTENGKPSSGTFNSSSSAWGMTVGIPFSFVQAKKHAPKPVQKQPAKSGCESYRSHCVRHI